MFQLSNQPTMYLLLVGENYTVTYRFKNGFYGLTTITAEVQKVMDTLTKEFLQEHSIIDEKLVVSKDTLLEHTALVEKILKKFDIGNASLGLLNSQIKLPMAGQSYQQNRNHAIDPKNKNN